LRLRLRIRSCIVRIVVLIICLRLPSVISRTSKADNVSGSDLAVSVKALFNLAAVDVALDRIKAVVIPLDNKSDVAKSSRVLKKYNVASLDLLSLGIPSSVFYEIIRHIANDSRAIVVRRLI
jgi:hypothetical protein